VAGMLTEEQKRMVEANLGLVHHVAKRFRSIGAKHFHDYDDLFNTGVIGLIKAVVNFRPEDFADSQFSTWAVPKIGMEIRRLINSNRTVKISRTAAEILLTIKKRGLTEETPQTISEQLGCTVLMAQMALDLLDLKTVSMEAKIKKADGEKATIYDLLPDYDDDTEIQIKDFLARLSHDERTLVLMRLKGKKQWQIGNVIGRKQNQVSRMQAMVRQKFLDYMRGEQIACNV
jgi:RNA polymerase sporulation-specific sigma factor